MRISAIYTGYIHFYQLMTADMPTIIGHNTTDIRPSHDCFWKMSQSPGTFLKVPGLPGPFSGQDFANKVQN